jgi:hypothetical protein
LSNSFKSEADSEGTLVACAGFDGGENGLRESDSWFFRRDYTCCGTRETGFELAEEGVGALLICFMDPIWGIHFLSFGKPKPAAFFKNSLGGIEATVGVLSLL